MKGSQMTLHGDVNIDKEQSITLESRPSHRTGTKLEQALPLSGVLTVQQEL